MFLWEYSCKRPALWNLNTCKMVWFHYKLESHFTSLESFAMVHDHFSANLGQVQIIFIPLYHANFIASWNFNASCNFNTKPDEMQVFSLSFLTFLFLCMFSSLKVQFGSNKPSEIFRKVSIKALWSKTAKFCTAALQSNGHGFSC